MEQLKSLNDRIVNRVNISLQEFDFNADAFVAKAMNHDKMLKFYAFYGITSQHPIHFNFSNSNISGSYFLGKCSVERSAIYKSDIRGDELKRKGDVSLRSNKLPLVQDEMIIIRHSLLYKTLVHNNSHNPGTPEEFVIRNTMSTHYANIHGSTLEGCFLGPFATVDFMNLHACIIGEFSYVMAGELFQTIVDPGTIWIRNPSFSFKYKFEKKVLDKFIGVNESYQPRGIIYDFVKEKEGDYESLFDVVHIIPVEAPSNSAVSRYAVIKGKTSIGENVLISQHAFLENAEMGKGSNAQENSYIIDSRLAGFNITAHGAKIINAEIGLETFVGFNCFLHGKARARLVIGDNCIIMPHTIIDSIEAIEIPDDHLVWGYIESQNDIDSQSISLDDLSDSRDTITVGKMTFTGKGSVFIGTFKKRINHILHANGAFFKDDENRGHAQDDQVISFNTIQPYRTGVNKGMYPSIRIEP